MQVPHKNYDGILGVPGRASYEDVPTPFRWRAPQCGVDRESAHGVPRRRRQCTRFSIEASGMIVSAVSLPSPRDTMIARSGSSPEGELL